MNDPHGDVLRWSACDQLAALASGSLSSRELLAATRERHSVINPVINAVVTTDFTAAECIADESDRRRARGFTPRPLEGLPVAVKDLEDTAGMRTTYGSILYANHVPSRDSLVVQRLRAAGAVVYGKTNTPDHGTGSHTYNRVHGTTTNPYDPTLSAGGSSGGAAAALAAGLSSVADGSDLGGSLRNPAAFCNVVGVRPSIGSVPNWPVADGWETLATNGPMARTVSDAALLLSVLSGPDCHAPVSFPGALQSSITPLDRTLRIGWSRTLDGLDIESEITSVLDRDGRTRLVDLGHRVSDLEPPLRTADTAFRTLRGLAYARSYGSLIDDHRHELSPELVANTEFGLRLTVQDYFDAVTARTSILGGMTQLFERIDVLAAPVTAVVAFPAEQNWPNVIAGQAQIDYLEWMRSCWRITLTGFPAISVPCGFNANGLPIGMQLIAPPRSEGMLLALAHQFEQANPVWQTRPRVLLDMEYDMATDGKEAL